MSQLIFPANLPGRTWPQSRTVLAPPVVIKTTPSRREFRARDSTVPLYLYSLPFSFLRIEAARPDWQTLMGFYNRVGGTFDDWLFDDRDDNTATAQLFGVGDGVTVTFQLARTLGGFLEPIYGLNGVPAITKDGVGITPLNISPLGAVTFAAAPSVGALLRWTGAFYWRCRFTNDSLEFAKSSASFYECKKVEFMTVKPL
jgi:hypothetical protein